MKDELIATLMLLFDGKDPEIICDAVLAYLSGNNHALYSIQRKLEDKLQSVTFISYGVTDLYDDINEKNDNLYDDDPLEIVCSDEIALKHIEAMRDYRRMEYSYDYFQEVKDLMIDEMIKNKHIVHVSEIKDEDDNPYWGG